MFKVFVWCFIKICLFTVNNMKYFMYILGEKGNAGVFFMAIVNILYTLF